MKRTLVITLPAKADDNFPPDAVAYELHENDERAWGQIRTWTSMVPTGCTWEVRPAPLRAATAA